MREDIQTALEKIRPALQADGGDVELVDVEDGIVSVRLTGACGGCPMSTLTLKMGSANRSPTSRKLSASRTGKSGLIYEV